MATIRRQKYVLFPQSKTKKNNKKTVKEINLEDGCNITHFLAIKDIARSHFETLYDEEEVTNPMSLVTMLDFIPSLVTS